jgi:hypothetical protein
LTARLPRLGAAVLAASCSLAVVAACGSSDNSNSSGDKLAASCKANTAINDGFDKFFTNTPALQSDKPPPKSAVPQIQANYDRYIAGPIAQIQKDPPEEIAGDIKTGVAGVKKIRDGDTSAFNNPSFNKATTRIDAFYFNKCSGPKSTVKGIDYAFDGLNPTFSPGQTQFKLQNTGKEVHEMQILKLKPGVKQSFAQVLKLPQNKAQALVDQVAGADAVPAGQSSYASANLTPGQYIAICFIPQGTTSLQKPGKGKPHFLLGMQKQFTVK